MRGILSLSFIFFLFFVLSSYIFEFSSSHTFFPIHPPPLSFLISPPTVWPQWSETMALGRISITGGPNTWLPSSYFLTTEHVNYELYQYMDAYRYKFKNYFAINKTISYFLKKINRSSLTRGCHHVTFLLLNI